MSTSKKAKVSVPFNAADVANIVKTQPYIQRLIEDAELRENIRVAVDSGRSAYGRATSGKSATDLLADKKLQKDLNQAVAAAREASNALSGSSKKRGGGLGLGRVLLLAGVGAGVALAASEGLRSKVLDTLFGAEEEFEYSPPAGTTPPTPAAPVSAA